MLFSLASATQWAIGKKREEINLKLKQSSNWVDQFCLHITVNERHELSIGKYTVNITSMVKN